MSHTYSIYIDKKLTTPEQGAIYRFWIEDHKNNLWVGAHAESDLHQHIYQGRIIQTFTNDKSKVKADKNIELYVERTFKDHKSNVGDIRWIQVNGISPSEAFCKDHKGTFNIALTCGPVILYPFGEGIHLSQRLKLYTEFAANLKQSITGCLKDGGVKFRVSARSYSLPQLERIIVFLKRSWQKQEYNHPSFLILNQLTPYLLEAKELFTNDLELGALVAEAKQFIFQEPLLIKGLPGDMEIYEDAWDFACQRMFPLACGGSILIEETAACIAIDLNSGAHPSSTKINQEAVSVLPKILYQGKFGGKIIIDLLAGSPIEAEQLIRAFKAGWESFDIQPQVLGISRMGLLELILPRRGYPLWYINKKILGN